MSCLPYCITRTGRVAGGQSWPWRDGGRHPAYAGWGAAAAGAAIGAAATSAAYAAATTNYYPPPYYQPNALLSTSGATAQMRPGAQAVLTECKPDIARFRNQVTPGQDRIKAGMKDHVHELSEPCKEGFFQAWLRQ